MSLLDLPRTTTRSTGIDLMRTLLALWVVLAHTIPWTVQTQGEDSVAGAAQFLAAQAGRVFQWNGETHPAVLAFIVLSGYCIHRNGLRISDFDVRTYCVRRFFRIVPTYLAAIGAGVALFLIISPLADAYKERTSTEAISMLCLTAKALGLTAFTPTIDQCAYQGNAPLRTVAVEMWLYVLYPIALLAMTWVKPRYLFALCTATVISGIVMVTIYPSTRMWWHNDSLIGYVAYWWIGAKALDLSFSETLRKRFLLLAAAWLVLTGPLYLGLTHSPAIVELRKLIFALTLAAVLPTIDRFQVWARWTELFGRAGYSIYAFHAPVVVTLMVFGTPWWLTIAGAFVVGLAMYFLVERPFDRLGRTIAHRVPIVSQRS